MYTVDVISDLGAYHRKIYVFLPESPAVRQIVYFHGMPGDSAVMAEKIWQGLGSLPDTKAAAFVLLEVEDWNRDLSPWPAAEIFVDTGDFAGGGASYLRDLCGQIIPQIENRYSQNMSVCRRMIGGYSMGGLFAVYAFCVRQEFSDILSVSGSLWYDGVTEYVKRWASDMQMPMNHKRAYFSLGQREPKTRNSRMQRVGEQTSAIQTMMSEQGISAYFQWNPGNHFQNVSERIALAICYMLNNDVV